MVKKKSKPVNKKNKTLLITAIVVVAVIVVVLLVLYVVNTVNETKAMLKDLSEMNAAEAMTFCNDKGESDKDMCLFQVAIINFLDEEHRDVNICTGISDYELKSGCISFFAGLVQDTTVCETIENPDDKITCNAFGTRDPSVCDQIMNSAAKISCVSQVEKLNAKLSRGDLGSIDLS